jgi:uncharacterized protein (TIGR00661 family)
VAHGYTPFVRILYGVVGEGMGHAIRSRVVLDELARHHDLEVVVSGRAHDYLKTIETDRLGVNRIWGLSIVYEDNQVRNFQTLLANVKGALVKGGWPENIRAFFDIAERFRPEVVISDFQSSPSTTSRSLPVANSRPRSWPVTTPSSSSPGPS